MAKPRKPTKPKIDKNGFTAENRAVLDQFTTEAMKGPIVGLSEVNSFVVARSLLERWDKTTNKPDYPATDNDKLERIAVIYLFGTRQVVFASGICYDETKWDNGLKCRTTCKEAVAEFSHPSLDGIWSDVQACANAALAAAGIAALLSGGAAAIATFKASFYACIMAKVGGWTSAIQVNVFPRESTGNWRWCA
ncbi:hypothetical protein [Pseudomonas fluorescens]|uniref:hypothetical protein n=1 Tax=Pseudomonas fluorescens TaxID=294 RepID=UPI0017865162|nr:hypothetical protein [Pseudomonas fluorescens]